MDDRELIDRLIEQNGVLIASLTAGLSGALQALSPAPIVQPPSSDPYAQDEEPRRGRGDPWGDPEVPSSELIGGWADPPFKEPLNDTGNTEEVGAGGEDPGT